MLVRRLLVMVFSLCLLVSLAPLVRADATADARKAIQAGFDKENAGAAKKDVQEALAPYAPDFVRTSVDGKKITLAEMKKGLTQMFAGVQTIKGTAVIQKITLKGKEATVTVKLHREITLLNPQTKKSSVIAVDVIGDTVWANNGKGWQEKSGRELSRKVTLDGKPIQASNG